MRESIDDTDLEILTMLQENARVANAEIARQVGLAPSAIFQRIRKLEDSGVIQGYTARIDAQALGWGLSAFVLVQTGEGARSSDVAAELGAIPEVREVHRVVGEDCFFLKVLVRDTDSLGRLLDERIQSLPAIASTRTTIVLKTAKDERSVPIQAPALAATG